MPILNEKHITLFGSDAQMTRCQAKSKRSNTCVYTGTICPKKIL